MQPELIYTGYTFRINGHPYPVNGGVFVLEYDQTIPVDIRIPDMPGKLIFHRPVVLAVHKSYT